MSRRLVLLLGFILACTPASKKPEPEGPREVVVETPEPVAPEDRTSAEPLREPEPDPRDKGKRGRSKKSPALVDDGSGSGGSSAKTAKTTKPAKGTKGTEEKPKGGLAKVTPMGPIPTDKDLGAIGLEILFMDVGQADAILVVGPKGVLLVDAGEVTQEQGKSDNYKKISTKIYELTGRKHLDYFVPSHYHVDHVGSARLSHGLWGVVDSGVSIGAIVDRGDYFFGVERPGGWKEYPESIQGWIDSGMVGRRVTATLGSGQIDLGEGVTVEVVSVNSNGVLEKKNEQNPGYFDKCPPSENDYSVGLKISVGNFEFFTGGDLSGEDVERKFGGACQSYNDVETTVAPLIGNVEVFKVTHHGSEHSNNELFLSTLDPEFAVIPSGGGYNHPAQDVAKRLIETALTVDTGGFAEKEWPSGPPPEIAVVGDVTVKVDTSGTRYEISYSTTTEIHRTYSDEEEKKGLDQKDAKQ